MHEYGVIKQYSRQSRLVACMRCKRLWGMNDDVKAFIPWDKELDDTMKLVYPDKFKE
jgi:hypothetical protein